MTEDIISNKDATTSSISAELGHNALPQRKISRRKQYFEFVAIIKAGRTPLEAARELGLSVTLLRRFIADAIMQKDFERHDFTYETVWAADLPKPLVVMLKATDADIVKATLLEDGSVKINIL